MKDKWAERIVDRFRDRKVLSKAELYSDYFAPLGLPERDVMECLDEIEFDYSIPVGILRPDDELTKLTEAVDTNDPLRWLFWRSKSEFREAELLDELKVRLKTHGTFNDWKSINTVGDLIRAWCGQKPT